MSALSKDENEDHSIIKLPKPNICDLKLFDSSSVRTKEISMFLNSEKIPNIKPC